MILRFAFGFRDVKRTRPKWPFVLLSGKRDEVFPFSEALHVLCTFAVTDSYISTRSKRSKDIEVSRPRDTKDAWWTRRQMINSLLQSVEIHCHVLLYTATSSNQNESINTIPKSEENKENVFPSSNYRCWARLAAVILPPCTGIIQKSRKSK